MYLQVSEFVEYWGTSNEVDTFNTIEFISSKDDVRQADNILNQSNPFSFLLQKGGRKKLYKKE